MTKKKTPATNGDTAPEAAPPVDTSRVYLCVWRDAQGIPRAYGCDVDKATAKKLAGKACGKYEKANIGTDLTGFDVYAVSVAK